MSTRWYPLYQKGNPQLRVFLPNFWMKLLKPNVDTVPKNKLKFMVSDEMSRMDVQNYLEKIYKVPVVSVHIYIQQGQTKKAPRKQYIIKDDDCKIAWVTLPKDVQFEFPDLHPTEKTQKDIEEERKQTETLKEQRQQMLDRLKYKPEVPGWFA